MPASITRAERSNPNPSLTLSPALAVAELTGADDEGVVSPSEFETFPKRTLSSAHTFRIPCIIDGVSSDETFRNAV